MSENVYMYTTTLCFSCLYFFLLQFLTKNELIFQNNTMKLFVNFKCLLKLSFCPPTPFSK